MRKLQTVLRDLLLALVLGLVLFFRFGRVQQPSAPPETEQSGAPVSQNGGMVTPRQPEGGK